MKIAARFFVAVFFGGLAYLAAQHIREDVRFSSLTVLGDQIFRGRAVANSDIEREGGNLPLQALIETCRSDILQNALRVELHYLDLQNRARDYDGWATAMGQGQSLVRHIRACNPANGDIWLRDAMIIRAIAEEPEKIAEDMAMATALLPSWKPGIDARLVLWNMLSEKSLGLSKASIMQDLQVVLNYYRPREINKLEKTLSTNFLPYYREALLLLPEVRQTAIKSFETQ